MKIESVELRASARSLEECPPSNLPEFAFIGRSNVGKSSLINALVERKEMAHTSSKPGKTQRINLYSVNQAWTLVDLPGYGYAKLSKARQEEFNREVSAYLTERENLKQVFLLIDSQIEPQGGDLSFASWLEECEVPFALVFTKADRNSDGKTAGQREQFLFALESWGLRVVNHFSCSAKTKLGRGQLLHCIEQQLPKKPKKQKGPALNLKWMRP